ncbi:transmembrane and coiled-coil domains protein 1 isoform X2 [Callorhinchus milii]|uniref:transmembrane and coiled-coil domains protein 1 isoform X2 n=1 Tax=Callorhinchus milii TaxID=7868 RepID=UPI001C3FE9E7|nr:transmembrane and coiled-coil domains protein 1 isoform X2 [Callorhinchus milii]
MEQSNNDPSLNDLDPGLRLTDTECRKQSESDHALSKITHNALENIGSIGQGLKQLFHHQRRRSSVSPQDGLQAQADQELSELENSKLASETESVPIQQSTAQATTLNRVLQQIRVAPIMKRGSSLQSRRSKVDLPRGSPQISRKSAPDGIPGLLLHSGRPRSSSTTDAPTSSVIFEPSAISPYSGDELDRIDRLEGNSFTQSSAVTCSSDGGISVDGIDGTLDPQRTKAAITHLQQKILKLTEQIKVEQTARDDNVAEYLKLANNADKQQSARIKQVFEKKNQKSAQTILQLQRKLEHYHRKLREVEQNGMPRQTKDVLRDMQQGLKDVGAKVTGFSEGVVGSVRGGLTTISQATHSAAGAVVSKPREIASLIRNKFGSADNISSLDDTQGDDSIKALGLSVTLQSSPKYGSEEDCSSATSGSVGANSMSGAPGGPPSSRTNTLDMGSSGLEAIFHEIHDVRETQAGLEESFEGLKSHYQRDYTFIVQTLQEERYRCERLEEQLNDLTELHQNEILNLKQELASMEEKMAYQSYERARDIQEALEACQTRISKMELQQQQQQAVQLEGLENATARTLLGKLINVLLAVMAVVLVFVSTVANCVVPLMKTRSRTFSTLFLVVLAAFAWKNWETIAGYMDRVLPPPG